MIIGAGIPFSLHYLPTPLNVLVGLLAFTLILVAALFGRVVVYAATGRWLQRKLFPSGANSETVALLLGTAFWIALASLPYIWPLVFSVLIVTSLGLALTARYRISWKPAKSQLVSAITGRRFPIVSLAFETCRLLISRWSHPTSRITKKPVTGI